MKGEGTNWVTQIWSNNDQSYFCLSQRCLMSYLWLNAAFCLYSLISLYMPQVYFSGKCRILICSYFYYVFSTSGIQWWVNNDRQAVHMTILTHLRVVKTAAILQPIFTNRFFFLWCNASLVNFHRILGHVPNWLQPSTSSINGLVPNRGQAIIN